ncbi:FliM/FliN family flagellar motor switch protein [Paludibacterium paludis]|uniref:Surface presentation of antigens protein SpaO n=1 Tax=Paludibacterium paludis TaxID=1225769 RepID=A0A918P617_9NEIS|nr:FliM/FliN family flagellar motor switch protein [Paludibacterium paludis]GGY23979.1 surface presentation of antigens protein SpaO [Paludibacterium paludis]
MSRPVFRRHDTASLSLDAACRRLTALGVEAVMSRCHPGERYLSFSCGEEGAAWEGCVPAGDWLAEALPVLAGVSLRGLSDGTLENLARRLPRSASLEVAGLPTQPFRVLSVFSGGNAVGISVGRVLITSVAESCLPAAPGALPANLPVTLDFLVGTGEMPVGAIKRLVPGDIVMIRSPGRTMLANGEPLFTYAFNEKEVVMEDHLDPAAAREPVAVTPDSPVGMIPVKLEFVLYSETRSLAELQNLRQGDALTLPEDAERQVKLMANGCRIGVGELVEIQGRLGVEITELTVGALHA